MTVAMVAGQPAFVAASARFVRADNKHILYCGQESCSASDDGPARDEVELG